MDANERKALRERAEAEIAWRDRGLAAPAWHPLTEREVLSLLDALEAAERVHGVIDVALAGERRMVASLVAERDELAAEVAAYQGRPEGALPEWRRADGYYVRHLPAEVVLTAAGCTWAVRQGVGRSRLVVEGKAATPLGAQRAAEDAARARGLL